MATFLAHRHPRGFANECELIRLPTRAAVARLIRDDPAVWASEQWEPLTVAEARQHIAWISAEDRNWGSKTPFSSRRWLEEVPLSRGT